MGRIARIVVFLVTALLPLAVAFGQTDAEGSKDYPGITRMPGYYIYQYKVAEFDSAPFMVSEKGKEHEQQVEGRVYQMEYIKREDAPATSTLQVVRNYQNAARASGGQILRDASFDSGGRRETTLRFAKEGKEVWLGIEARDDHHFIVIVEKQLMRQDVVVDAQTLGRDIVETGRVAIYGIYFDTAKSELKPESDAAIAEIAKLLKLTPSLKVFIVGHTDMVGDSAANVKLSQARAQSVVMALTKNHGIAESRLTAFGNGPYSPVASNKEESGRAKNRRVELVEIATK